MAQLNVGVFGVGYLGKEIVRSVKRRDGLSMVAAVDTDEDKLGADVGTLCTEGEIGVEITDRLDERRAESLDLIFHTTGPADLPGARETLIRCLETGSDVISSVEELSYPFETHPELASELDTMATNEGATLLGTGLLPNFIELLMVLSTRPCDIVESIEYVREADLSGFDESERVARNYGIDVSERSAFERGVKAGTIKGHSGGEESVRLVCDSLDVDVSAVEKTVSPILSGEEGIDVSTEVAGISTRFESRTENGGTQVVVEHRGYTFDPEGENGEVETGDRITVDGTPAFEVEISPSLPGNASTAYHMVNISEGVARKDGGLTTVLEYPLEAAAK